MLVGGAGTALGQSLWLREIAGREAGPPPDVDLLAERAHGDFVRGLIGEGLVAACHDVSDGGLLVAVAEMALAGGVGARLAALDGAPHVAWFGEDQARYILAVADADRVLDRAAAAGIPALPLGVASGDGLTLPGGATISIDTLRAAHERFFPEWMGD